MGTKWGPKKRIFDKLTETCKFIEMNSFFGEKIFTEGVIIQCTVFVPFLMNKLNIHRKFLQLVFVITSDQMVDIIVAALTFDAFLSLNGENGDFQKKWGPNGDQKTHFGPHGDQSPQMGTNVGAVLMLGGLDLFYF